MKGLKFYDKFIFFLNIVFALALLIAYILPFIPPKTFPTISVLSLGIGPLLILNILFFLYWLFKVSYQLLLSLIVLLIGFVNLSSFYKFSESKIVKDKANISVMSYNVKSFNRYEWIAQKGLSDSIANFVEAEAPQILAIQEYYSLSSKIDDLFRYKYTNFKQGNNRFGQAILSSLPIINSGSVNFRSAGNNAIYSDIVIRKDTIRVYNAHFESLRITPNVKNLQDEGAESVIWRMGRVFKQQQEQAEQLLAHIEQCPYRTIICTDLNNSAFSYIYKELKGKTHNDAFKQAGNGFGKSFDVDLFPLRIDFILIDNSMIINSFKTYKKKFSDHFPIQADIKL